MVIPNRYTSKRIIVTKQPLHTPFELRKPKLIKLLKSNLCRQKPVTRNIKPITSSCRSSVMPKTPEHPNPTQPDSQYHLPTPYWPTPQLLLPTLTHSRILYQEASHLPSIQVPPYCHRSPSTTRENKLAPLNFVSSSEKISG